MIKRTNIKLLGEEPEDILFLVDPDSQVWNLIPNANVDLYHGRVGFLYENFEFLLSSDISIEDKLAKLQDTKLFNFWESNKKITGGYPESKKNDIEPDSYSLLDLLGDAFFNQYLLYNDNSDKIAKEAKFNTQEPYFQEIFKKALNKNFQLVSYLHDSFVAKVSNEESIEKSSVDNVVNGMIELLNEQKAKNNEDLSEKLKVIFPRNDRFKDSE